MRGAGAPRFWEPDIGFQPDQQVGNPAENQEVTKEGSELEETLGVWSNPGGICPQTFLTLPVPKEVVRLSTLGAPTGCHAL